MWLFFFPLRCPFCWVFVSSAPGQHFCKEGFPPARSKTEFFCRALAIWNKPDKKQCQSGTVQRFLFTFNFLHWKSQQPGKKRWGLKSRGGQGPPEFCGILWILQPQNLNSRQIFVLWCFDGISVTQGAHTALGGTVEGFILNRYFVKSLCNSEPILLWNEAVTPFFLGASCLREHF